VKRYSIETYEINGVPITTLAKEEALACPTVFHIHGFTGDKRDGLPLGYRLAEAGFFFVSIDAHMHGERHDERLANAWEPHEDHLYPTATGLDAYYLMHEIIEKTAQDIEGLIEHMAGDERADVSRLGISGVSMGGYTTFYLAANNPAVKAAVALVGVPAFSARWQDALLEASSYTQWAEAMHNARAKTAAQSAFIERLDPFEKLSGFCPKPLLMICGDKDIDAPKKYAVDLYRQLKPLYAERPDQLRLSIHDDADHKVTSTMLEEACDWFSENL
jgi:pimeloyl-ACP methyl ester carboxylesterase